MDPLLLLVLVLLVLFMTGSMTIGGNIFQVLLVICVVVLLVRLIQGRP